MYQHTLNSFNAFHSSSVNAFVRAFRGSEVTSRRGSYAFVSAAGASAGVDSDMISEQDMDVDDVGRKRATVNLEVGCAWMIARTCYKDQ